MKKVKKPTQTRKPTLKKRLIGYVDATPTWESILPAMLEANAAGGRRAEAMRLDFVRMARAADGYNQLKRHGRVPK